MFKSIIFILSSLCLSLAASAATLNQENMRGTYLVRGQDAFLEFVVRLKGNGDHEITQRELRGGTITCKGTYALVKKSLNLKHRCPGSDMEFSVSVNLKRQTTKTLAIGAKVAADLGELGRLGVTVSRIGLAEERVALAMAQANAAPELAKKMIVQTERTEVISSAETEGGKLRVYVQTFENSSAESVRIYEVTLDLDSASVTNAELVGSEGFIGG